MAENVQDFSDSEFDSQVLSNDLPVVVDFWAPWCGPCKALTPTMERLASEYSGKLAIGKMDIQTHPQTAVRYGIRSIPALLFFKGGEVKDSLIGAVPEDKIKEKIERILD